MNRKSHLFWIPLGLATAFVFMPETAHAYGGPGSIITGIGALLAAVAAIGAALFGFVWFPLKTLVRSIRGGSKKHERAHHPGGSDDRTSW